MLFSTAPVFSRAAARVFAILSLVWLASCDVAPVSGTGPNLGAGRSVEVALLVPGGGTDVADAFLAQNLENAARMAIADLNGVQIDLRVYNTGADPQQAAAVAVRAANEGAKIIIGPLYAESANAAGVAVAGRGINVLAFSNNVQIAGGNVFVLGATFENTAARLASFAARSGLTRVMILHGDDIPGQAGRDAISAGVRSAGGIVVGTQSYPLSQQAIIESAPSMASAVRNSGAQAVFLTAGANADLPILATSLPEQGIDPAVTRYIGLTRWDVTPQGLALPGLQGGLFAMPDMSVSSQFEARYGALYGSTPHPLAGLAYDGIAAIGALVASGNPDALSRAALTQPQGFQGTSGIFRFLSNGTNQRGLAVAQVQNNQVVVLEPAPRSFGGAGF